MSKISPCLWFNGVAEEAANFYVALFGDGKITSISHYGPGMPLPEGTVLVVEFTLFGDTYQALNAGDEFPFTEAISLSVSAKDQAEVDRLWDGLISGGGEPSQCGWLKDRFGVSWQVVPEAMTRMEASGDAAGIQRMMLAMMKMKKLDIATLERAFAGN